ncbi:hypothetical protein L3Y34_018326 [Caenorhabditis briggsae]|uniref:C2H2-type domain-containing protein n=1 Tax=Caenorhabditis briggsae TaxID=6238 RepID=A0AAE9DJU5_CAEBR|nr:hypothetical protein L3Y34_018326 [Caenorhabditis briggsae]
MQMREAKPYKCTQCVKAFANSSYLSQHMRIHLGIKPFGPCNYCGKKFTQLSHLQQHIRTHTGEKPYKCKFTGCDKAFSQLSNLQSHSRCHQSDKPFKCNSCYKCFTDEQSLLDHIPKHKESKHLKIHICPFCGKSYTQQTYLQKHMTKHADRSKANNFGNEVVPADPFDPSLLAWNPMQGMGDAAHDASSFNISSLTDQFAANTMIGSQGAPYNPAFQNSAFSQLFNIRNNRYLSEYPTSTKNGERAPGFNMITPLENIQRYNGNSSTSSATAVVTATGSAVVSSTPSSTSSSSAASSSSQGGEKNAKRTSSIVCEIDQTTSAHSSQRNWSRAKKASLETEETHKRPLNRTMRGMARLNYNINDDNYNPNEGQNHSYEDFIAETNRTFLARENEGVPFEPGDSVLARSFVTGFVHDLDQFPSDDNEALSVQPMRSVSFPSGPRRSIIPQNPMKLLVEYVSSRGSVEFESLPSEDQNLVNFNSNIFKVISTKPGEMFVNLFDRTLDASALKDGNCLRYPVEADLCWMSEFTDSVKQ